MTVRQKIIVALFLVTAAIALGATGFSYRLLQDSLGEEFRARLKDLAHLGAAGVDLSAAGRLVGRLGEADNPEQVDRIEASADYRRLDRHLNAVRDADPRLIQYAYILVPTGDPNTARFLVDADVLAWKAREAKGEKATEEVSHFGLAYDISDKTFIRQAFASQKLVVEDSFVDDPKYNTRSLSAYAPIRGERGEFLGIFGVDLKDQDMAAALAQSRQASAAIIVLALLATVPLSIFVGRRLTEGIRRLNEVVLKFALKQFDVRAPVLSQDEIGNLSTSFNAMAETIDSYARQLEALLAAYGRFVPHSFLDFLGKKSVVDLKLGDHVQREMTVLFADIRSFTSLSESMTPRENFEFVNAFLRRVGPEIRGHGGVIDKYIGDAVMALFPGAAQDALRAAIDMQRQVTDYNEGRRRAGYRPIAIGVGLHTGRLILGTVGEAERMNSTVISDNVNLASRLEGVTKHYGVNIVISDATLALLPADAGFKVRFLDKIQVKGKHDPVIIHEVFDADAEPILAYKEATLEEWKQATGCYFARRFAEAEALFRSLLERNPDDLTAQLYLARIEECRRDGVGEDWTGVLVMDSK
jgi:class 3 adenylate cyclase